MKQVKQCKTLNCQLPYRAGGYCKVHYAYYHYRSPHIRKSQHKLSNSAEYKSWSSMKSRCYNPKATGFEYWGGRGIKVCERWLNSFEDFLLDMGSRPIGTTLDRINNEGNYEPKNCRWSSNSEQKINRRMPRNNKTGFKGVSMTSEKNRKQRWMAIITRDGRKYNIGRFYSKEEAIRAYEEFAASLEAAKKPDYATV